MTESKYEQLQQELRSKAKKFGYEIAAGKRGSGWMAYSKGGFEDETGIPFPKTDPINNEDVLTFVDRWQETDQYRHEMKPIFKKLRKYYGEKFIHLYTEIDVGFEDGFLQYMIETELQ